MGLGSILSKGDDAASAFGKYNKSQRTITNLLLVPEFLVAIGAIGYVLVKRVL